MHEIYQVTLHSHVHGLKNRVPKISDPEVESIEWLFVKGAFVGVVVNLARDKPVAIVPTQIKGIRLNVTAKSKRNPARADAAQSAGASNA